MQRAIFPKDFTGGFQKRAFDLEIDWRNALTKGLYGAWFFGSGPPRNLVTRAFDPQNDVPQGNFGHGSYSGTGAPAHAQEFHGPAARWTGAHGIALSLPAAFQIERTEPLTIMAWLTPNVLRSGAALNYALWTNNADDGGAFRGARYHLNWDGASKTKQEFGLSSNFGTGNYLLCNDATDIPNVRQVLGVSYTGSSLVSGVTFFLSGDIHSATSVTNALTATTVATTPIPAIGRRTVSAAAAQVFKGDLALLLFWRGRGLGSAMEEVDTNFDQMFLVPSYRRWSFPAAAAGGTAIPIRRAGVYV